MNHRHREKDVKEERQRDERCKFSKRGRGEKIVELITSPNFFVLIPLVCRAADLGISTQKWRHVAHSTPPLLIGEVQPSTYQRKAFYHGSNQSNQGSCGRPPQRRGGG